MHRCASLLTAIALTWLCQCQSLPPDYVRNPNQWRTSTPPGSTTVFTHAPAMSREVGPVTATRPLSGNWKHVVKKMKEQAAGMGANAIIVPRLAAYDRAALPEAYLGEEGAFSPGPPSRQLKMSPRAQGLAIQLP